MVRALTLLLLLTLSASAQTPRIPPPESVNRNGLVGIWAFVGGVSGNGSIPTKLLDGLKMRPASNTGSASAGMFGGRFAAIFDGTTRQFQHQNVGIVGPPVTIMFWINPTTTQKQYAGVWLARTGATPHGIHFNSSANTLRLAYMWNGNSLSYNWNTGPVLSSNVWQFLVLEVQPTKAQYIFYDAKGAKTTFVNSDYGVPQTMTMSGSPTFGLDNDGNRQFNGRLSYFRIYSRILANNEKDLIYRGLQ